MRKTLLSVILLLAFVDCVNAQAPLKRKDGTYTVGDSIFEIDSHKEFGYISEFISVKGEPRKLYRAYEYSNKILVDTGTFEDGWFVGVRTLYNPRGEKTKRIDYDTNHCKIYDARRSENDEIIDFVLARADSIMERRVGKDFFAKNMIQNTNRSFYEAGGEHIDWWFDSDKKATDFRICYDIKVPGGKRFCIVQLSFDKHGRLYGSQPEAFAFEDSDALLTLVQAREVASKNGMDANPDGEFEADWNDSTGRLEYRFFVYLPSQGCIVSSKSYRIDALTGEFLGN